MSQIPLEYMQPKKKKNCWFLYTNFLVCGGDFSVTLKRKKTSTSSFYRYFSILRSDRSAIIYTRFHTFYFHIKWYYTWRLSYIYSVEKNGYVKKFFVVLLVRDMDEDGWLLTMARRLRTIHRYVSYSSE